MENYLSSSLFHVVKWTIYQEENFQTTTGTTFKICSGLQADCYNIQNEGEKEV